MNDIGKNIRFLRTRKKLSQDQLAETLHVTRQTVSNYETGRSRPDVEMLTTLAAALDADVKEILYAPADREAHVRRLRRLVASAVVAALLGILETAGLAWGRQLMQKSYIPSVSYLVVYFVHPLFYLLLGWTLARGVWSCCGQITADRRWAVRGRWVLLAIMAVWLMVMAPFFPLSGECIIPDAVCLLLSSVSLPGLRLFTQCHSAVRLPSSQGNSLGGTCCGVVF